MERAEIIGCAGLCRVVVQLMEKHGRLLRIQRDGLRCAVALCQAPACVKLFKANGGCETISNARLFLKSFLETPDVPVAESYTVKELRELIKQSSSKKFNSTSCFMS